MRKLLIIILILFIPNLANATQLFKTTAYSPSPSGRYKNLSLEQMLFNPSTVALGNPCLSGSTFLSTTDMKLYFCDDDDDNPSVLVGTWELLGSTAWTVDPGNNSIYPELIQTATDTTYNVGIGTQTPQAEFEIQRQGVNAGDYTGLRLSEDQGDDAIWEIRSNHVYNSNVGPPFLPAIADFFTIWGGVETRTDIEGPQTRLMITSDGMVGIGLVADGNLGAPRLDVPRSPFDVRRGSTLYPSPLMSGDNLDSLRLLATFSIDDNPIVGDAVGIGFAASVVGPDEGGAGIAFERTQAYPVGKLHIATREDTGAATSMSTSLLPIRMTLDEFGDFGIGTTDPVSELHIEATSFDDVTSGTGDEIATIVLEDTNDGGILGAVEFDDDAVEEGTNSDVEVAIAGTSNSELEIYFDWNKNAATAEDPYITLDNTGTAVGNGGSIKLSNDSVQPADEYAMTGLGNLRVLRGRVAIDAAGDWDQAASQGIGYTVVHLTKGFYQVFYDASVVQFSGAPTPVVSPWNAPSPSIPTATVLNVTSTSFTVAMVGIVPQGGFPCNDQTGTPVPCDIKMDFQDNAFTFIVVGLR